MYNTYVVLNSKIYKKMSKITLEKELEMEYDFSIPKERSVPF